MSMHLVHLGVTQTPYNLKIGAQSVKLTAGARFTTTNLSLHRDDMEAAVAAFPADLAVVYDGLLVIDATVPAGSGSPTATATGLLATDTILAASQKTKGANSLPLLGFGTPGAGTIPLSYSADPGANGVVRLLVMR